MIIKWPPILITALALWLVSFLSITYWGENEEVALFSFAPFTIIEKTDAIIVNRMGNFMLLRSQTPRLAQRLYAQGAWLVLPSLRGGCRTKSRLP